MATITVKIDTRIPQVTASVRAKVAAGINKVAHDIEAQAKLRAPVDTGLLRNSINTQKKGDLAYIVESPVFYSIFQEFGTYKMRAQPYMVPAVELISPQIPRIIGRLA